MKNMAKQLTNQRKWRPWKGIILFFVAAAIILGGSLLTVKLGTLLGMIVLQGSLLLTAIICCFINRTPVKEVFPLRGITVRDFFGTAMMWAGGLMFGMMSIYVTAILFPNVYEAVIDSMQTITSGPRIASLIITVVLPPICEEAIVRGAILSNFRSLKRDWVIILIVGLMFGALHMDPIRFINTAILGGISAYLIVKRDNFVLAWLVHFINNGFAFVMSTISDLGGDDAAEAAKEAAAAIETSKGQTLASLMVFFCIAPILLVIGSHLIKRQREISEGLEPSGMRLGFKILIAGVIAFILFSAGIGYTVMNMPDMEKIKEAAGAVTFLSAR